MSSECAHKHANLKPGETKTSSWYGWLSKKTQNRGNVQPASAKVKYLPLNTSKAPSLTFFTCLIMQQPTEEQKFLVFYVVSDIIH